MYDLTSNLTFNIVNKTKYLFVNKCVLFVGNKSDIQKHTFNCDLPIKNINISNKNGIDINIIMEIFYKTPKYKELCEKAASYIFVMIE